MKENWILPCNVKFFDVNDYFETHDTIVWRRVSAIHEGDVVYIYVGAPFSEIKYKCHVIDENISEEELAENSYAIPDKKGNERKMHFIKMKLDYKYEAGIFPLENLRENGLGQVQVQARTDRRLQAYISSIEQDLINT